MQDLYGSENKNLTEHFVRRTASWKEVTITAAANVLVARANELGLSLFESNTTKTGEKSLYSANISDECFFVKDTLNIWLDKNWDAVCTDRARTATWWATVGSVLYTGREVFECVGEQKNRSAGSKFTLKNRDLFQIFPKSCSTSKPSKSTIHLMSSRKRKIYTEDHRLNSEEAPFHDSQSTFSESSTHNSTNSPEIPFNDEIKNNDPSSSFQPSDRLIPSFENLKEPTYAIDNKFSINSFLDYKRPRRDRTISNDSTHAFELAVEVLTSLSCSKETKKQSSVCYPSVNISNSTSFSLNSQEKASLSNLNFPSRNDYVLLSNQDRISSSQMNGWGSVSANTGVTQGNWYCEFIVRSNGYTQPEYYKSPIVPTNCRIGVTTNPKNLNNIESNTLWYCDNGIALFKSGYTKYGETFNIGDVIGVFISFPTIPKTPISQNKYYTSLNNQRLEQDVVDGLIMMRTSSLPQMLGYKPSNRNLNSATNMKMHMESVQMDPRVEKAVTSSPPYVEYFKNGKSLGKIAINSLLGAGQRGVFPCLAMCCRVTLECNFGPWFRCMPESRDTEWRPFCESA
ncbi:hypothetical protein HK096_008617 [Nowakowskiella sp. JEL0078]|nr:hypothetical protein HK096_008617 [Nowakowskiella sp. JEL0078]